MPELMRRLNVVTAKKQATEVWPQQKMSWAELLGWLDLDRPAGRKDCGCYVLGELKGERRTKATVLTRSGVALDADNASDTFALDSATALDCAMALYTTWSHTPEKPRWRLLAPLSRDVTPDEYRLIVGALMIDLGYEQFDKGSTQPERLMHKPSTQGHYSRQVTPGEPLDADWWLAKAKELGIESELQQDAYIDTSPVRPESHGVHPYAQKAISAELAKLDALPHPWFKGANWDQGTFNVACNLVEFSNSNWSGYTLANAQWDLVEHAPSDSEWGRKDHEVKFASAINKVNGGGRPVPEDDRGKPEDDFGTRFEEPPTDQFLKDVEREARLLRVREAARDLVARERRADAERPALVRLDAFLEEPDDPVAYRVDRLWPTNGRIVLATQNKSGKTTLTGNLIRCLVDGDRFLDEFDVRKASRVVLIDNELSPTMIRKWLREQRIVNTGAADVVSMRGRLSTFNILDPVVRKEWATAIGTADVLIFDCLRPALDALGMSEDKESGRFLEALDELAAEAGIAELLLVHHMGHSNERSRGDSRLEDWPDAKWKLVREDPDDPVSARYFSAFGRDVDQPEVRLAYNLVDRHLSVSGGSRIQYTANQTEREVLAFVTESPGCTQSAIERAVNRDRMSVREAIRSLDKIGEIRIETKGQARLHFAEIGETR